MMRQLGINIATAREIYTHIVMKFPDKSKRLEFRSPVQVGKILECMSIDFERANESSAKLYLIR